MCNSQTGMYERAHCLVSFGYTSTGSCKAAPLPVLVVLWPLCVSLYCRLEILLWVIGWTVQFAANIVFFAPLSSQEFHQQEKQTHWCTKIHLFETISKWQFLYRRNIEIKMKQDITDDACIVDFCALENITLPSEKPQILIFQVWIPPEILARVWCNVAFRVSDKKICQWSKWTMKK